MQLGIQDSFEASPLVIGDTMYLVTPKPNHVYALDLTRQGAIKWEFRPEFADFETTVRSACCGAQTRGLAYADGRIFFVTLDGQVFSLDAETGEVIWQKRAGGGGNFHGSPVCVDGRLFCADDKGTVVVLSASEKFEVLGRNELGDTCRSTPAVSGGRMFVRTESRLFSVGGKKD